ncbi:MAG: mechanosensitive ion channel [Deltaproteobacteria bacterium]|nr:mechanosensitive ion channel [Deltaproteobacteria bacterium]
MLWDELPWLIGLFVAVVVTAAAVNFVHPQNRPRLRRVVVLYTLYTSAMGAAIAFHTIDRPTWSDNVALAGSLLQGLLVVSIAAMLVFSVALPTVGVQLPRIASDLVIGLGAIAVILVVLSRRGLDATDALVSGAVVSAVLALSLQSTLGNILGGVALQLDGSIKEGDWVALDAGTGITGAAAGRLGRVRAVRWRHTVVELRDFSTVIVPNAQLLANSITILGRRDGNETMPRIGVMFSVDFRYAPGRIIRLVNEALALAPIDNVCEAPAPVTSCLDFASRDGREALVTYVVRYSIHDLALEEGTSSRIRARVYSALRRDGIPLGMPAMLAYSEPADEVLTRRLSREVDERLAVLRRIQLFQAFTDDELRTLAVAMNDASYSLGETITKQGATAHWLYVLAEGKVEVRTNIDPDGPGGEPDRPVFVAQITAPEIFGVMGLVTGEPRVADVIAVTDVECFRLGKQAFEKVLLARPEIATGLSERIAARRVELLAARDGLDDVSGKRQTETERIKKAITNFFGL